MSIQIFQSMNFTLLTQIIFQIANKIKNFALLFSFLFKYLLIFFIILFPFIKLHRTFYFSIYIFVYFFIHRLLRYLLSRSMYFNKRFMYLPIFSCYMYIFDKKAKRYSKYKLPKSEKYNSTTRIVSIRTKLDFLLS